MPLLDIIAKFGIKSLWTTVFASSIVLIKQAVIACLFRLLIDDLTEFIDYNIWKFLRLFMIVVIIQAGYIQLLRRPFRFERAAID